MQSKYLRRSFFGIIVVFLVLISVFSFGFAEDDRDEDVAIADEVVLIDDWQLANSSLEFGEGSIAIHRRVTQDDYLNVKDLCIFFKMKNLKVFAKTDDNELFHIQKVGNRYVGSENGNVVCCVELPSKDFAPYDLSLEFYSSYDAPDFLKGFYKSIAKNIITPKIYLGDKVEAQNFYFKKCLIPAIFSITIIGCGLICLVLFFGIYFSKREYFRGIYYFSFFSIVVGIGFLIESGILDMSVSNSFYLYFLSTLIISVLPEFFNIFCDATKTIPMNFRLANVFSFVSCFNVLLVCFCAFTNFIPFSFIRNYVIVVLIGYNFFMVLINLTESISFGQRIKFDIVAYIIMSVAMIVDLVFDIVPPGYSDLFRFTRPCFLVFMIFIIYEHFSTFHINEILEIRQAAYKEYTLSDQLTATGSRMHFWQYAKEVMDSSQSTIVLGFCKVLNLKEINNKFGYVNGDFTLKVVADYLKDIFGEKNVFKFDDASFVIVSYLNTVEESEKDFKMLVENLEKYNEDNIFGSIKIAYVIASYDKGSDEEFEKFVAQLNDNLHAEIAQIRR